MKQLNSVLIEGFVTGTPREREGFVFFNIMNDGVLNLEIVTKSDFPAFMIESLSKGRMVRIVGQLRETYIFAEHIELRMEK
jgi:aspartyl/asparaginyl-tRNA synthetase